MFDIVRNNPRLIQFFLALIMLPFAFFGVDAYFRDSSGVGDVATVDGAKISIQEFQRALREQQERMRSSMGGQIDPALLDSPEIRHGVLDQLVSQRLVALYAGKAKLSISDPQLRAVIAAEPSLHENGKFSIERYKMLVAAQGMSEEMFEARLRTDLAIRQAMSVVGDAGVSGRAGTDSWVATQLEEREIAEALLRPQAYESQVKLPPDAIRSFYETNRKQFEIPEQLRAEFVVLSQEKLIEQASVTEDEIKTAYRSHVDRYKQPEERRAAHILIPLPKGASEAEVKAAQATAEEVLSKVKRAPGDFAKIAKQYSKDPGSAANGGDLGWFGRGAMVPPFEQAAFSLKENEIGDIVRTDFGLHVIRLVGIRAERARPLEEVRGEVADELKRQQVTKKYAELAEAFTNMVYEQPDSLQPVIERFGLVPQTSDWMARGGKTLPPFTHPKLISALFADDAIKNKRNTEAIEVANNMLVAARVVEHKPAMLQSLESVTAAIEKHLVRQEAIKLATKDGEEKQDRLTKGETVDLVWGAARIVARAHAPSLSPDAVAAVFKVDAAKLPAYAGAATPAGYALYRVSQVKPYAATGEEPPRAKALKQQYRTLVANEEFVAWIAALRDRYKVDINRTAIESKERP